MKLLLIDLDNTLIDLSEFKKHLFSGLELRHRISMDKSTAIYNNVKKKDHWPRLLVEQLHIEFQVPLEDLQVLFESCFSKITPMNKSIEYLKNFEGKKYIFSFGAHDLQMKKINQFELEKLVDGIFITLDSKIDYLSKMIENDTIIIDAVAYTEVTVVDNDLDFLTKLKIEFPWVEAIPVTDIV